MRSWWNARAARAVRQLSMSWGTRTVAASIGASFVIVQLSEASHTAQCQVGARGTGGDLPSMGLATPSRDPAHLAELLSSYKDGMPVFVGIAGGTGSGKTTVAKAIADRLGPAQLVHISHDSYYRDQSHLPSDQRGQTNFDHPDALETDLLVKHLEALRRGETVQIPQYDFTTHSRISGTEQIAPTRIVLVEGILIFAHPELIDMLDIKIFVDTDADLRFIRRLRRDISERGRDVDSVIHQYTDTVRPMHDQFVEPSKRFSDVIIPTGLNSVALEMVIARLELLCRCEDMETANLVRAKANVSAAST